MDEQRTWYGRGPVVPAPAPAAEESKAHRQLRIDCGYYLGLAAAVGVIGAVCLAKTGGWGLNAFLYALMWCVCAGLAARRLGRASLRRDGFWLGGILLLSLTVVWTANRFLQTVSVTGGILLQGLFLLDLFADTRDWHFGKAAGAMIRLFFRAVGRFREPFAHLLRRRDQSGRGRSILLGLLIALPLAVVVISLLSWADGVFSSLWSRLTSWEGLETVLSRLAVFLLASLLFYGGLCAQTDRPESADQTPVRQADTLVAVTFTAVLAIIYALFCAIQIVMLFRTDGTGLPAGWTYARYARQGFFELLVVGGINVLLVIVSQRRFRTSRGLRALLTFISGCTWLMLFSSARRMILYVQDYGLTFLRLLVLWFLLVLAVILAGATVTVFRPGFRLFRFSLAVGLTAWLLFAFARPDALAARYDLARFGCGDTALRLIRYQLACDAVGELRPYLASEKETVEVYMDGYLDKEIPARQEKAGVLGFNCSLWRAGQTAEEYVNGK